MGIWFKELKPYKKDDIEQAVSEIIDSKEEFEQVQNIIYSRDIRINKNEEYDRKLDERADKNNYRTL